MTVIKHTNKENIGMCVLMEFISDKMKKMGKTWIFPHAGHPQFNYHGCPTW